MKKIKLIFDTVQVVNAFILLISMIDKNDAVFLVSCILCWALIFIRFISNVIMKKKNNNSYSKNKCQFIEYIKLNKLQIDNALMVIGKLEELVNIIDSKGSYYEAQRKYIEIKQIINELSEEKLKSSQKKEMLEILEGLSEEMLNLELKR